MNMKIVSAIALAMGITVAGSAIAASGDPIAGGTITFNGSLLPGTCTITGTGVASGAGNIVVPIQPAPISALAAANAVAGLTTFGLQVGGPGQDCTNGAVAALSFTPGSFVDGTTGALKNSTAQGMASNVEVQVTTAAGAAIKIATGDATNLLLSSTIANNTANITLGAQYLAVNGAATAGDVNTQAQYTVVYN